MATQAQNKELGANEVLTGQGWGVNLSIGQVAKAGGVVLGSAEILFLLNGCTPGERNTTVGVRGIRPGLTGETSEDATASSGEQLAPGLLIWDQFSQMGADRSKLRAIDSDVNRTWFIDPHGRVLIFSRSGLAGDKLPKHEAKGWVWEAYTGDRGVDKGEAQERTYKGFPSSDVEIRTGLNTEGRDGHLGVQVFENKGEVSVRIDTFTIPEVVMEVGLGDAEKLLILDPAAREAFNDMAANWHKAQELEVGGAAAVVRLEGKADVSLRPATVIDPSIEQIRRLVPDSLEEGALYGGILILAFLLYLRSRVNNHRASQKLVVVEQLSEETQEAIEEASGAVGAMEVRVKTDLEGVKATVQATKAEVTARADQAHRHSQAAITAANSAIREVGHAKVALERGTVAAERAVQDSKDRIAQEATQQRAALGDLTKRIEENRRK